MNYCCPLVGSLPALLPLANREIPPIPKDLRATFRINPTCQHLPTGIAPPGLELYQPLLACLEPAPEGILWVKQPLYGMWEPYWPDREMAALVTALVQGRLSPGDLSDVQFHLLCLANILLPHIWDACQAFGGTLMAQGLASLRTQQYALLPALISPLQVTALRTYTRHLEKAGQLKPEISPAVVRWYKYNDPVMRFFHFQMDAAISRVVDEDAMASYCYLAYYEKTGLAKHQDRDQCVWNLSIPLDPDPEVPQAELSPLWFELPEGPQGVIAGLGDAILYRGTDVYHWRYALPRGHRLTVSLYHFVPLHFPGQLD
jgi:hypothetical protein